ASKMGKRKLYTGIAIGAAVGGLIALLDRDARSYAKQKFHDAKDATMYYAKHPSEGVQNIKDKYGQFNTTFTSGADNAINALEQVEETIEKFSKKEPKNWTTRRIKRRKEKKMDAEKVAGFLKQLYQRVVSEDVFGLAAQLAYFFLLSLFPFLLFLLTLIGYLPLDLDNITAFIETYAPPEIMEWVMTNIQQLAKRQNSG